MTDRKPSPDKKTQILRATTELIRDKGLQALSFEGVARQAGLSRQLVRYYFPDIEALIVELCDYLGGIYSETLVSGVVKVGQVERLAFFLDFFFELAEGHPMPDNLEAYARRLCGGFGGAAQQAVPAIQDSGRRDLARTGDLASRTGWPILPGTVLHLRVHDARALEFRGDAGPYARTQPTGAPGDR